jgi:hypothetical protein
MGMEGSNDLGDLQAHARGRVVVRGEDVERVLALVPEQVWMFTIDVPANNRETVEADIDIPMKVRREIISHVLLTLVQ